MIKAEDLRIGDLVQHESHVLKITGLHNIGSVFTEHRILGENELTPIPITTEILEKNGWKLITYDFNHVCFVHRNTDVFNLKVSSKGECLKVELDLMPSYARICNHTLSLPKIKYVHELQHILWTLGEDANLTI